MNELRVVSGFHRGVSLPLDDEPILIGSSLEADLVLSDPGIAEVHAKIENTGNGWHLSSIKGGVSDEYGNGINAVNVSMNQNFNIAGVWIQFTEKDSPWVSSEAMKYKTHKQETQKVKASKKGLNLKMIIFSALAFIGILTATHASVGEKKSPEAESPEVMSDSMKEKIAFERKEQDARERESLLIIFKKMLRERRLQDVKMDTSGDTWNLDGSMDEEKIAILKRMIVRFSKRYPNSLTINNNVKPIDYALPFDVVRVVSGPYGHIEVDDGHKIYLGSEYKGMKLVSITSNELFFSGKTNITVNW